MGLNFMLYPDKSQTTHQVLPINLFDFFDKLGNGSIITIISSKNEVWDVKIYKESNKYYLQEGWNKVFNDMNVIESVFITLRYGGLRIFYINQFFYDDAKNDDKKFFLFSTIPNRNYIVVPNHIVKQLDLIKNLNETIFINCKPLGVWSLLFSQIDGEYVLTNNWLKIQEDLYTHGFDLFVFQKVSDRVYDIDVYCNDLLEVRSRNFDYALGDEDLVGFQDGVEDVDMECFVGADVEDELELSDVLGQYFVNDGDNEVMEITRQITSKFRFPKEFAEFAELPIKESINVMYVDGSVKELGIRRERDGRFALKNWSKCLKDNGLHEHAQCSFTYVKAENLIVLIKP